MKKTQPTHRKGLGFKKLDLHLHTPASKCFADKSVIPEAIVDAALAKGLDGIAVTDHNSGEWVDKVKKAAEIKTLIVFPGVEITCMGGKEGIHIIALFDPKAGTKEIESLLGDLELKPEQYGDIKTVVQKSPFEVAETISRRGGLAILAHANSSKGALEEMRGQQRINFIQCRWISGAEGTDFQDTVAQKDRKRVVDLLDGSDPAYKRKLAVYQSSDNPTGKGDGQHGIAGIGTRCSYFKLDQINIDGLAQCLSDPDVRIRQDYECVANTYPHITQIKVTGGFLDGAVATFHEGLNSILGAKGAGKSLVIEFLRFALKQPPLNKEIKLDHESKLEHRLENYGTVEVTFIDETGRAFSIKRTWNPSEDNPYSEDIPNPAESFPALFLSQNEIIKIAENESEQIAFIDQFFDFRIYQQEIAELDEQLEKLDMALAESLQAYREQIELDKAISTSNKEVAALDEKLKNPVFDEYAKLETKDRVFREQLTSLDGILAQLDTTKNEYNRLQGPVPPTELTNDPALKRVSDYITQAKTTILEQHDETIVKVKMLRTQADAEHKKWLPQFQSAKNTYSDTVQKAGGDYKNLAQKRAKIVKDLAGLQRKLTITKQRSDQTKEIGQQREAAITALKKAYEKYSKERKQRCQKIEQESGDKLTVRIHESSNVDEFKSRLTSLKKGSYLRDIDIDSICQKTDPGSFIKAVIRHVIFDKTQTLEDLAKTIGIDNARMLTLSEYLGNEYPIEQLLALEHKALPQDRPEIRYNVGDNTFEPLDRLSVGQKCTAMLIVALSDGKFPIIIDQPEDSLDIRTIWEDMCMKIRRGKERRQFIFTTHNSSLAVASDTDKFTILVADATRGRIVYSGSMDHPPVNDEVITYLEGGPDTYKTKAKKYRFDRME